MSEVEDQRERALLGIDTSGSEGSLAISRMAAHGDLTLVRQTMLAGRHYADEVVPQLKEQLAKAGVVLADFSAIVVVNGPGSFTGLRAGLGAAKALAEAVGIPLLAVSRLALLAGAYADALAFTSRSVTVAVFDAGRGEYYMRVPDGKESVVSQDELAAAAGSTPIRVCEVKVKEQLAHLQVDLVPPPTAFDATLLAVPRFIAGNYDDVATLDANYVRRPYANFAGPV